MSRLSNVFKPDSGYQAFFLSMIAWGLAYGLYKGAIENYFAEIVAMSEFDRGVSEFFRELPGLSLIFILAILYTLSAEKIYKIGAVIMLVGMVMHAMVPPARVFVTLSVFIYSLGEHIQLGMKNTLSLEYAREGKGGTALGLQNSANQAGTVVGYLVIMILFFLTGSTLTAFRGVFWAAAAVLSVSFFAASFMKNTSHPSETKSRFYFKKKFRKYYMLELFYGARKQVFFTFGPYVLILFYGASTSTISLLFAISAVTSFFASPLIGKIIDRFGYKIVMITDTLILVAVCFFYGFAHHLFPMHTAFIICCINYLLDSVISLASMASNVYVQDLADSPEEVRATISTGLSVNHLVTILIALFGGWIWHTLGIETLFILSAILGLCNSAYAATIKTSCKT